MKNSFSAMAIAWSFLLATPAAHAWNDKGKTTQTQQQKQQADADARAKAAADAQAKATVGNVSSSAQGGKGGNSSSDSSSSAKGGAATGGDSSLAGSGNGEGTASTGPISTTTSNNTRMLYVNLPTMPVVAPTVTGFGSSPAISSLCGPLMEKVRKPIQYLIVGHFGTKTITLEGQFTDELEPVIENGQVKKFDTIDNGDGTFSERGTIYTETAIVITSSVSKQFGLGLFGGSGGGSASNGVAGTTTGTERIIAIGSCEYRKYGIAKVPGPTVEDLKKENDDLHQKVTNLTRTIDEKIRK